MPTFGCRWTMFVLTREWQSLLSGSDSEIVALFYSQMLWSCFFGVNLGYYFIWDDVFVACFVKVSDICRMCVAWIWVVLGSRRMRRVPEDAILHSYVLCLNHWTREECMLPDYVLNRWTREECTLPSYVLNNSFWARRDNHKYNTSSLALNHNR